MNINFALPSCCSLTFYNKDCRKIGQTFQILFSLLHIYKDKDKNVQYKFSPKLTSTPLSRIKTHLSQVRLRESKLSETVGYVTLREVQYILLLQTGHMLGLCCWSLTQVIDISTSPLPRFRDQSTP
jgi:hypothetical protein